MGQCPFHPQAAKNKLGTLLTFLIKRRSWLDGLYERSYKMKVGEVKLPNHHLYVVNDKKEVKKILVDEVKTFPKSEVLHELLKPLLGESVFTTNGDQWKGQRELLNPSFTDLSVSRIYTEMVNAISDEVTHIESLLNKTKDNIIEVDKEMTYITADIIFRTILSAKLDRKQAEEIIEAFEIYQELTVKTAMKSFFNIPKVIIMLLGERKRIKAGEKIRKSLGDIIKKRYDLVESGEEDPNVDILTTLLKVRDTKTNERFTYEEILDQIAMLFLAGHETTASSLTWALYCLSLSPEIQEEAYQEIISINSDSDFDLKELKQFKKVNNIFKETLRLYPPVGFLTRENNEDTKIRDKEIKKGSSIVVAPWLIHRHEDYWENPNEFIPSRWESDVKIDKNTYLPFGMGERVCIGAGFAKQESILILATLIRKYKITLKKDFVPDVVGRLTIRSANGMYLKLEKR